MPAPVSALPEPVADIKTAAPEAATVGPEDVKKEEGNNARS